MLAPPLSKLKLLLIAVLAKGVFSACYLPEDDWHTEYRYIDDYRIENQISFCTSTNTQSVCVYPIYKRLDELNVNVGYEAVADNQLSKPGKIYLYADYLFSVMQYQGIAVYKIDGEKTQQTGFIRIPGVSDLSIANQYLYANSYTDLLKIDLLDLTAPVERLQQVFSYDLYSNMQYLPEPYHFYYDELATDQGVLVGYQTQEGEQVYFQQLNLNQE